MLEVKDNDGKCVVDITIEHDKVGNALHCCSQRSFAAGATAILKLINDKMFVNYASDQRVKSFINKTEYVNMQR